MPPFQRFDVNGFVGFVRPHDKYPPLFLVLDFLTHPGDGKIDLTSGNDVAFCSVRVVSLYAPLFPPHISLDVSSNSSNGCRSPATHTTPHGPLRVCSPTVAGKLVL